jgi:hypothetical protein
MSKVYSNEENFKGKWCKPVIKCSVGTMNK